MTEPRILTSSGAGALTLAGAAAPAPSGHREAAHRSPKRLPVLSVARLLAEQKSLTAVERFAEQHEQGDLPPHAKLYKDLVPLERPKAGEQYSFEVNLDKCTGCKACVSACHTLNGLDDQEMWRSVGLLHGGSPAAPTQQTVTTSCHHCVEPACMTGCPVNAYEKDPVTGIVKHLDDQCFGCQYCTLMCPYDAPKYNAARGIVRKCDMCSDRLEHGEAPACVQACPNGAIAIRVVEQTQAIQTSEAGTFLPGAPGPEHTMPTTVYKTARALPPNLLPADFYTTSPEQPHLPLVVLLTLTQLAAGVIAVKGLTDLISDEAHAHALVHASVAAALTLIALGVGVFHLGRPWLAWRAVINLRRSWFSREALAFGIFAKLVLLYGALVALPELGAPFSALVTGLEPVFAFHDVVLKLAAMSGVGAVYCSVMVYVATKRPHWSAVRTGVKFFGTSIILGTLTVLVVSSLAARGDLRDTDSFRTLVEVLIAATALKLAYEGSLLLHLRDRQHSNEKRMATVMLGDLRTITLSRFATGIVGGVIIPVAVLSAAMAASTVTVLLLAALALLLGSELCERYLFFRAAPASRMPGGLR